MDKILKQSDENFPPKELTARAKKRADYLYKSGEISKYRNMDLDHPDLKVLKDINHQLELDASLKKEFKDSPTDFLYENGFKLPEGYKVEFIEDHQSGRLIEIRVGYITIFK